MKRALILFLLIAIYLNGCAYRRKEVTYGWQRVHRIRRVVIDPGHGGKDPGAIGRGGLKEKDLVLDVSLKLARALEGKGINVILTRTKDVFFPLWKRCEIANDEGADLFISVHANASRKRKAHGFEVYYLSEAIDDNARALEAAENAVLRFENSQNEYHSRDVKTTLWDIFHTENRVESIELAQSICKRVKKNFSFIKDRGVKSARFHVLKGTRMPAILVEIGFLSNYREEAKLRREFYKQAMARAIADGILDYKRIYDRTNGFTK